MDANTPQEAALSPAEAHLRKVEALLTEHEQLQRMGCYSGDPVVRTRAVLDFYQRLAVDHAAGANAFRQDVLTYLRAMVLLAEAAGNGGTNRIKEERCRALVEMLESAIKKIAAERIDFHLSRLPSPDLWRSDYPVREYVRRIHALEDEANRWRRLYGEKAPPPADDQPF